MEARNVDPWAPAIPPGQDELPWQDGAPMDSPKHGAQMTLLKESLLPHVPPNTFIGTNMFVYFSLHQATNNDFRGPDFFVVLDALSGRERKSWVVWEEGGRYPNIVIELLSPSTEAEDRGTKMRIYAAIMGVAEYYLFDPDDGRFEGYRLVGMNYLPIAPRPDGDVDCTLLGLRLGVREGTYQGIPSRWLRWKSANGDVLPTAEERALTAEARAERLAARLRALGEEPD